MQSQNSRSHLLKGDVRQSADTVAKQVKSTNREIDCDVTNDIAAIVIWQYSHKTVGRLFATVLRREGSRNAVGDCFATVLRLHCDCIGLRGCSMYLYVELLFSYIELYPLK